MDYVVAVIVAVVVSTILSVGWVTAMLLILE